MNSYKELNFWQKYFPIWLQKKYEHIANRDVFLQLSCPQVSCWVFDMVILGSQIKIARLDWPKCYLIRSGFFTWPITNSKTLQFSTVTMPFWSKHFLRLFLEKMTSEKPLQIAKYYSSKYLSNLKQFRRKSSRLGCAFLLNV